MKQAENAAAKESEMSSHAKDKYRSFGILMCWLQAPVMQAPVMQAPVSCLECACWRIGFPRSRGAPALMGWCCCRRRERLLGRVQYVTLPKRLRRVNHVASRFDFSTLTAELVDHPVDRFLGGVGVCVVKQIVAAAWQRDVSGVLSNPNSNILARG